MLVKGNVKSQTIRQTRQKQPKRNVQRSKKPTSDLSRLTYTQHIRLVAYVAFYFTSTSQNYFVIPDPRILDLLNSAKNFLKIDLYQYSIVETTANMIIFAYFATI